MSTFSFLVGRIVFLCVYIFIRIEVTCGVAKTSFGPFLRFLKPEYAHISKYKELTLEYEVFHFSVPQDGYVLLHTNKKSEQPYHRIDSGLDCVITTAPEKKYCRGTVFMQNLAPGTHLISASLHRASGEKVFPVSKVAVPSHAEYNNHIILDAVPSQWKPMKVENEVDIEIRTQQNEAEPTRKQKQVLDIVFVGSLGYDGQKAIWKAQLEMLAAFNSSQYVFNINFVTFLSQERSSSEPFLPVLKQNNIFVQRAPLRFTQEIWKTVSSVDEAMSLLRKRVSLIHKFEFGKLRERHICSKRLWELFNLCIYNWGVDAVVSMYGALSGNDISVFANSQSSSDAVLAQMCRVSGASVIVMDLPNLFPIIDLEAVTTLVAPSNYAALHPSITSALSNDHHENNDILIRESRRDLQLVVIHPGVNTSKFVPEENVKGSEKCQIIPATMDSIQEGDTTKETGTIVIGYVGRVVAEKSPGLFIHMASFLVHNTTFCDTRRCRFVLIGNGEVLWGLKRMASKLHVEIEFKGAVYEELPKFIQTFDVLVNPSLRSTSETFCIVNVEAMAMGVPIVSFGAGGIMDYLIDEVNGILVKSVSVEALAHEVIRLFTHFKDKIPKLKKAARELVMEKFRLQDMVAQYRILYERLFQKFGMCQWK